jgi:hypothetical protein
LGRKIKQYMAEGRLIMSKTNHRRGDKDDRFNVGQRTHCFDTFHGVSVTMDGRAINASSSIATENSKGVRRDKAGAKKFIASRTRFHNRMACDKIVREGSLED